MSNSEFITHVTEELDKVGSPYFEDSDLLRRGKESTYKILEEMFPLMESDQVVRGEMNFLVDTYRSVSPVGDLSYSEPNDFLRLLSLTAEYNGITVPAKIVQANDFQKLVGDPFNKPTEKYPLCTVDLNGFKIVPEPTSLIYTYIKEPMFGTFEGDSFVEGMSNSLFYKIANDVIRGAMATTSDQRYQIKSHQSDRQ